MFQIRCLRRIFFALLCAINRAPFFSRTQTNVLRFVACAIILHAAALAQAGIGRDIWCVMVVDHHAGFAARHFFEIVHQCNHSDVLRFSLASAGIGGNCRCLGEAQGIRFLSVCDKDDMRPRCVFDDEPPIVPIGTRMRDIFVCRLFFPHRTVYPSSVTNSMGWYCFRGGLLGLRFACGVAGTFQLFADLVKVLCCFV